MMMFHYVIIGHLSNDRKWSERFFWISESEFESFMGKNWQNLVDAIQIYLRFLVHFFLLKAQKTQNLIRRCLIFIGKFVWCGVVSVHAISIVCPWSIKCSLYPLKHKKHKGNHVIWCWRGIPKWSRVGACAHRDVA